MFFPRGGSRNCRRSFVGMRKRLVMYLSIFLSKQADPPPLFNSHCIHHHVFIRPPYIQSSPYPKICSTVRSSQMVAHEHGVMPSTLCCTLGDRKDGFYRSIIIGSEAESRALVINCKRTQRTSSGRPVPEKGLGLCPLHDASNYEEKLPAELKGRKGGVLLPMGISEGK